MLSGPGCVGTDRALSCGREVARFERKGILDMGGSPLFLAESRSGTPRAGIAARDAPRTRLADGDHPRGTRPGPASPGVIPLAGAPLAVRSRSSWMVAGRQPARARIPANTATRHPADARAGTLSVPPIRPARRPERDGTPAPAPAAIWAFPPPSPSPARRIVACIAETEARTRAFV